MQRSTHTNIMLMGGNHIIYRISLSSQWLMCIYECASASTVKVSCKVDSLVPCCYNKNKCDYNKNYGVLCYSHVTYIFKLLHSAAMAIDSEIILLLHHLSVWTLYTSSHWLTPAAWTLTFFSLYFWEFIIVILYVECPDLPLIICHMLCKYNVCNYFVFMASFIICWEISNFE